MTPEFEKFFTEAYRRSFDRGKAEGMDEGMAAGIAAGEARALLMVLKRRGLVVTDDQQHRILTCTRFSTVDRWLDLAFSAASVDEIFA